MNVSKLVKWNPSLKCTKRNIILREIIQLLPNQDYLIELGRDLKALSKSGGGTWRYRATWSFPRYVNDVLIKNL